MGSCDGVGIGQGLRERGVPLAGTHGDLLSAEPALGSGSGEGEGSLAHPCFLQKGSVQRCWTDCLAFHSVFARPLLPPEVFAKAEGTLASPLPQK